VPIKSGMKAALCWVTRNDYSCAFDDTGTCIALRVGAKKPLAGRGRWSAMNCAWPLPANDGKGGIRFVLASA